MTRLDSRLVPGSPRWLTTELLLPAKVPSYAMTGKGTGVIGRRGLLAALAGCVLAAAAAAGPATAQRSGSNPEELWRAYPLEQSPTRASAPEQRPRRAQPAEGSRDGWDPTIVAVAAAAAGALLAGGVLALMALRGRRPPALRAPLPTARSANPPASRSPPPRWPGPPAPETCWIVCWRGNGRAAFYAIARDADGHQQFIGESPAFATTPNAPLVLEGAAFDALQSLATRLSERGWEAAVPVGAPGAVWHAQEFRRKKVMTELRR